MPKLTEKEIQRLRLHAEFLLEQGNLDEAEAISDDDAFFEQALDIYVQMIMSKGRLLRPKWQWYIKDRALFKSETYVEKRSPIRKSWVNSISHRRIATAGNYKTILLGTSAIQLQQRR